MNLCVDQPRVNFGHLQPHPAPGLESWRLPPPPQNLTRIRFQGASKYLEEILDAPRLDDFENNLLQSNHTRRTATLPAHQSETITEGTGKGPHRI